MNQFLSMQIMTEKGGEEASMAISFNVLKPENNRSEGLSMLLTLWRCLFLLPSLTRLIAH